MESWWGKTNFKKLSLSQNCNCIYAQCTCITHICKLCSNFFICRLIAINRIWSGWIYIKAIYCRCNFLIEKYSMPFNGEICAQFDSRKGRIHKLYLATWKNSFCLHLALIKATVQWISSLEGNCPNGLLTPHPQPCGHFVALCGTCISTSLWNHVRISSITGNYLKAYMHPNRFNCNEV